MTSLVPEGVSHFKRTDFRKLQVEVKMRNRTGPWNEPLLCFKIAKMWPEIRDAFRCTTSKPSGMALLHPSLVENKPKDRYLNRHSHPQVFILAEQLRTLGQSPVSRHKDSTDLTVRPKWGSGQPGGNVCMRSGDPYLKESHCSLTRHSSEGRRAECAKCRHTCAHQVQGKKA